MTNGATITTLEASSPESLLDSGRSTLPPNLYINGIGNCPGSQSWRKNREFAENRDALWVPVYVASNTEKCPDLINDALIDVVQADRNIPTFDNGLDRIPPGQYDTCWGYSGGTVTIVTALLQRGVQCNHLVLISPFLTNGTELGQIVASGTDVTVYQSDADKNIPGQYKVPINDPLRNQIDVRDVEGIRHEGWIPCLNNGQTFFGDPNKCDTGGARSSSTTNVQTARDPNAKHVDREYAQPGEEMHFMVEFENEGEGIAYGVYITDTLEDDIDTSSLVLPPDEHGHYDPATRTITWYIGEVGPAGKGEFHFSSRVRSDAVCGDEVTNYATVFFPSVPETTPTNGVSVRVVHPSCDGDQDGLHDFQDTCPAVFNPADADQDGLFGEDGIDDQDNDGDGLIDEDYEPGQEDADNDGQGDACDEDDDNDTMIDAFEVAYVCLNPFVNDAGTDPDGDGHTNHDEFVAVTDPCPVVEQPPTAPTLSQPPNGIQISTSFPTFAWEEIWNATSYRIIIDNNCDFSSHEVDATAATATYLTTTALLDGSYCWRVLASNDVGDSPWSSPFTFILNTLPPTAAPTLRTPINVSVVTNVCTQFTWARLANATSFRLQVDNDPTFGSPELDVPVTGTSYTPTISLAQGIYYWRMRGLSAGGNAGPWSMTPRFTIAIQRSPANASYNGDTTPSFLWYPAVGATTYTLEVDNNPDYSSPEYTCTAQAPLVTCTPTSALAFGTYWWRVNINGQPSPISWTVTITPLPLPNPPAIVSPVNRSFTNDPTPGLTWQPSTSTIGQPFSYEAQVDDNSAFTSPEFACRTSETHCTVTPALPNQRFFWRVRTLNSVGAPGGWSSAGTFTVDTVAPPKVQLVSPRAGSWTNDTTPMFGWSAATGANIYHLQADDDPNFGSPAVDVTLSGRSYTVPNNTPLNSATRYYWRLQVQDAAGNKAAWSNRWFFNLDILRLPEDGFASSDTTPAFSWHALTGATAYTLQVDNDPDFSSLEFACPLSTTSCTPQTGLPFDHYYWRVLIGGTDPTLVRTLIITPLPLPNPPALVSPVNRSFTNDPTPDLTWQPSISAVGQPFSYEVQVDDHPSFTSPEFACRTAETHCTVTPALPNQRFFWRVRTLNSVGAPGRWSGTGTFTVDTLPPNAPTVTSPVSNLVTTNRTPVIRWMAVNEAKVYVVAIDDQANISSPLWFQTSSPSFLYSSKRRSIS